MSLDVAIAVVGATILLPGLFSTPLKRLGLSVPLVALTLGVLLGPELLAVVDPRACSPRGSGRSAWPRSTTRCTAAGRRARTPFLHPFTPEIDDRP